MVLRNLDQVNQKMMITFNKRDSDEPIPPHEDLITCNESDNDEQL